MQSLARIPLRRDPAPSRWAYRMQRLWLTPMFRVLCRVGLPGVVLASVTGLVLMDQGRRDAITGVFSHLTEQFQARPEFRVNLMSVEGASPELADAVRARLGVKLPMSSFDLDLLALRARAEAMDAVAADELRVRSGGVLQVTITEREPMLVWRKDDTRIEMLDAQGHRVAALAERADRPDLPLIAGEGADAAAAEALALIDAAGPLLPRMRGLVRMGERRWDMVLDRDQRILLPAENPVQALVALLALNTADDLLARDLTAIDLRDPARLVLRLTPNALTEARRARGIVDKTAKTESSL
ncbi:cell division protein FtsQ/DivIB [Paracoccaceae bacterium]